MSIASISSTMAVAQQSPKMASDGDTAAIEARENYATRNAEKLNGGFQPKPAPTQSAAPPTPGGVNKMA